MGDVVSSHLDEGKREIITARTGTVLGEFSHLYEKQYVVALFNKVRYDVEGGGGPQPQLLRRKVPLANKSIFSGTLFQYLEENKKWRNRFLFIPDSYNISYYESKQAHNRGLQPKGTINCAGYRVLISMESYLELLNSSLPDVKAKVGSSPFLKCATQFPLILWHPYACHHYFCVGSAEEQQKWNAVFQDCIRHTNNGLSEECKVQTPAFTDAVRLYRQARNQYGTWDMMCGLPPQILANLVMETLLSELRDLISPRLKGKLHDRQRSWILISDAVYSLVQSQAQSQYEAIVQRCEAGRPPLEASIRTDMDQIITSKEHVGSKIRALVHPKAEKLLKVSIEPYITSILEALMEPTSRGFFEVRDIFFRELVNMSKNLLNGGSKEKLGEYMEKISMLAFHPVKMQPCYEKVEQLQLEGLQQRFDVTSPSVFVQRAQILMREQMDDAVYTFEQLLHQSLEAQEGKEDLCKAIQGCQDRVIKKFDYDSSTVRKRFFREALLQIFIPYMLKQLSPSCSVDFPHFQELIFEDFSRFILVENIFEEVVLQTVMKDIMLAVKEAAVQRRHNLYRDSIVLTNSDPNLHLLGENPPIDWAGEYGGGQQEVDGEQGNEHEDAETRRRCRMKQVVSMIQEDGATPALPESCLEVPGVDDIPEEEGEGGPLAPPTPSSEKEAITKEEVNGPPPKEAPPTIPNGTTLNKEKTTNPSTQEAVPMSPQDSESKLAIECAIQEIEDAVQEADGEQGGEGGTLEMIEVAPPPKMEDASFPMEHSGTISNKEVQPAPGSQREVQMEAVSIQEDEGVLPGPEEAQPPAKAEEELAKEEHRHETAANASDSCSELQPTAAHCSLPHHDDSGFQSPANEVAEEEALQAAMATTKIGEEKQNDCETGQEHAGKEDTPKAQTQITNENN